MSPMIFDTSKSFGRVDPGDAGGQQRALVVRRDDAAHHHGDLAGAGRAQLLQHRGDQLRVGAREDREAHHVHALLHRGGRDAGRREADALVDHVHPGVTRPHGDLLGPVGVAVEPRLAHQDLDPAPERLGHPLDTVPKLVESLIGRSRRRIANPRRPAILTEHIAQRGRPLTGGDPRLSRLQSGRHHVHAGVSHGRPQRSPERPRPPRRPERSATKQQPSICRASTAGSTVRIPPSSPSCSGDGRRLGEHVLAHHLLLAALDPPDPRAVRLHELRSSCRAPPRRHRRARPPRPSRLARPPRARRRARPSPPSPRTGRGTRGGRSRGRGSAGCAATTAGPTAAAGRAPRSTRAAGGRGRARRDRSVTASASSTIRMMLFSGWDSVRPSELTCTP